MNKFHTLPIYKRTIITNHERFSLTVWGKVILTNLTIKTFSLLPVKVNVLRGEIINEDTITPLKAVLMVIRTQVFDLVTALILVATLTLFWSPSNMAKVHPHDCWIIKMRKIWLLIFKLSFRFPIKNLKVSVIYQFIILLINIVSIRTRNNILIVAMYFTL